MLVVRSLAAASFTASGQAGNIPTALIFFEEETVGSQSLHTQSIILFSQSE